MACAKGPVETSDSSLLPFLFLACGGCDSGAIDANCGRSATTETPTGRRDSGRGVATEVIVLLCDELAVATSLASVARVR